MARDGGGERKGNYWTLGMFVVCFSFSQLKPNMFMTVQCVQCLNSNFFSSFFALEIDPSFGDMFENGNFRRRRRMKRPYRTGFPKGLETYPGGAASYAYHSRTSILANTFQPYRYETQ